MKETSIEGVVLVCNSSKNSFEGILQKWNCRLWDFFFYFDKKVQEDNDDKDKVCPQIWRSKLQWNKEELNFHKKGIFRILKVVCM